MNSFLWKISSEMCELLNLRHVERFLPWNTIANSTEKLKWIQTSRGKHWNIKPELETSFDVATPPRQVNNKIVYLVVKPSKSKHFALAERFFLLIRIVVYPMVEILRVSLLSGARLKKAFLQLSLVVSIKLKAGRKDLFLWTYSDNDLHWKWIRHLLNNVWAERFQEGVMQYPTTELIRM